MALRMLPRRSRGKETAAPVRHRTAGRIGENCQLRANQRGLRTGRRTQNPDADAHSSGMDCADARSRRARGTRREAPVDFALHEPQALNNGMIAEYNHPTYGLLRVVGNQIRFSDGHSVGAASVSDLPPPLLGHHSHEILREIDYS